MGSDHCSGMTRSLRRSSRSHAYLMLLALTLLNVTIRSHTFCYSQSYRFGKLTSGPFYASRRSTVSVLRSSASLDAAAVQLAAACEEGTAVELHSLSGHRLLLIGTAHVSARDAESVRQIVAKLRPDSVVLELDA